MPMRLTVKTRGPYAYAPIAFQSFPKVSCRRYLLNSSLNIEPRNIPRKSIPPHIESRVMGRVTKPSHGFKFIKRSQNNIGNSPR